ncbi:maleylpyruvate isomerase family mycothiol-dependent enzyme [Streptomyces sp. TRM 70361]|uniref:maleylpyruvate isomerase family mycothiol-dependent enzyme n=1 Tax=Streptomyces sp. TRM 70361 TaxID=3116553 RepID=UPI002E7AD0C3|nr:maleylpyruvate isomerase family mycothiol-dependent enzyme [Streptomyces sp. TRM 70361]MEE1939751.1 maleylpyruvate isomerase family mycothiol-dependent enzyme [Streptomyces sp. TRM 70361]
MDPDLLLGRLRRELGAFRACLDDGHRSLSAPVTHCGEWTLHDLAAHLGRGNLWAAAAVTEGHGGLRPPPAPGEPAALARWFDGTCAVLLDALAADPSAPAWTFHPPHTVGFWRRRRALETLVHRWDAEHALGAARPLDPETAGEGVAEVFDTMAPRQLARGRARPPDRAVRLTATDTGASWTYGPGTSAATLSAPAERLLLVLWGRLPADGGAVAWEGDRAAGLRVLAGPLVP